MWSGTMQPSERDQDEEKDRPGRHGEGEGEAAWRRTRIDKQHNLNQDEEEKKYIFHRRR